MRHRTVGDDITEATTAIEHAVESEGYDQLSAGDRAHLRESLHYLEQLSDG